MSLKHVAYPSSVICEQLVGLHFYVIILISIFELMQFSFVALAGYGSVEIQH